MEDLSRSAVRVLAVAALMLGLSATAACTDSNAGPVAPSPGVDTGSASATPEQSVPVTPGPGVTKPGIRLVAVPRSDGSFDVTEDVMLPEAMNILQLQVPSSGEHLPGMMAKTAPQATNLKVVADDQSVPLEATTVNGAADLPLTTAATRIRLTYRLSGSVIRSTQSKPERAGAAIRPLTAGAEGTLPTSLSVTSGLLNAVCPLLTDTRCAVGDPPKLGIQPDIPASKALVVLQLDLPRSP
ncbi:MAG TPA: hypothetical protein VFI00_10290 [Kribbella sp.]|nr:hypothetical protein [Kribbella sp.]